MNMPTSNFTTCVAKHSFGGGIHVFDGRLTIDYQNRIRSAGYDRAVQRFTKPQSLQGTF
jgi:hypothetical protein